MNDDWGGPHLLADAFCTRVEIPADGLPWSIIEIKGGEAIPETVAPGNMYRASLLTAFTRGNAEGEHVVSLRALAPAGPANEDHEIYRVTFAPDQRTSVRQTNVNIPSYPAGIWYFTLSIDGRAMTTIPFEIIHRPQHAGNRFAA